MKNKKIIVLGTLDSKGAEHKFVADKIRQQGFEVVLVDVGTYQEPTIEVDITRFQVTTGFDLKSVMAKKDRGECVEAMAKYAPSYIANLIAQDSSIKGIISLGGGGGTAIGSAVMRALPMGFAKIMVSTLASGNTAHYIGTSDLIMIPSIVDVAGLNQISKDVFSKAALCVCALASKEEEVTKQNNLIAASMFGNTTECINKAKEVFEKAGYEVLVFHATGTGGEMMEKLIKADYFSAVYDVTTTEWADELIGATLSAGPTRLDMASTKNIPTIIAPGCLDMANFGELDSLPEKFQGRTVYKHNPQVTLLRTNKQECTQLGKIIAQKANQYPSDKVVVALPLRGISVISQEGQSFYDAQADAALFNAIRENLNSDIKIIEVDNHINSDEFASITANELLDKLK